MNVPKVREQRHERVALRRRRCRARLASTGCSRARAVERRLQRVASIVGPAHAGRRVAAVRHEDVVDLPGASEQLLRGGERQQHRGAVGAGAVVADDVLDDDGRGRPRRGRQVITAPRAELVDGAIVDVHLAGREVGERDASPVGRRDRSEAGEVD